MHQRATLKQIISLLLTFLPLLQVLLEKTATTTSITVQITIARMEEPVSMESTTTTASVGQNLQVCIETIHYMCKHEPEVFIIFILGL